MYLRTEGYFQGFLDAKLYYQKWTPPVSRGTVVITHGHGEHSDSYHRVVDALGNQEWTIIAWDWRGHGRSDGLRGYAEHFNDYCNDFEAFMQKMGQAGNFDNGPVVLLSHSMGGLIQLKSILAHPEWRIAGQVLSSPLLGFALPVPAFKDAAAQWLQSLLPKVTLWNEIKSEYLSRDADIIKEFSKDSLRHDRICAGVYLGSTEAMEFVKARTERIQTPLLLQIADNDQVVSTPKNKEFFSKLTCPKKMCVYEGHKHELYNDLDREKVFADLIEFLNQRR